MKKTRITKNEHMQLAGLLAIGRQHVAKADDARRAAYELLGFDPDEMEGECGHIDDAIYDGNNRSTGDLLKRLKITIR